jgi:hypothetical protein
MKDLCIGLALAALLLATRAQAEEASELARALTLHASLDEHLDADFSRGDRACYFAQGKEAVPAQPNELVKIAPGAGRFGGALWFPRKGTFRPQYKGANVLRYNAVNWSASVSVWLRLDPDRDLEPGYCDPVQIVGNDSKKGFIFLEWSKDETPRLFRFAIRPLFEIWNPTNVQWADIPFDKRPMVQVERAPFSHDKWTHVLFSFTKINDQASKPIGKLYINGESKGAIENWNLTFGWNPDQVLLVLGASYVGYMDDLAVFNRALTDAEAKRVFGLSIGVRELYPSPSK